MNGTPDLRRSAQRPLAIALAAVVSVPAMVWTLGAPAPAEAYATLGGGCRFGANQGNTSYRQQGSIEAEFINAANSGDQRWDGVNHVGPNFFSTSSSNSTVDIRQFYDSGVTSTARVRNSSNAYASSTCSGFTTWTDANMHWNKAVSAGRGFYNNLTAMHEFGHIHGLGHWWKGADNNCDPVFNGVMKTSSATMYNNCYWGYPTNDDIAGIELLYN